MIRDFSRLSGEDRCTLDRARHISKSDGSGIRVKLDTFVDAIGDEGVHRLSHIVRQARKPQSALFREALGDLSERMHKAQELRMDQLRDGTQNELVDHAIWSYRYGLSSEALVHFIMYHMFERTLRAGMKSDTQSAVREISKPKDFLPLGDYIALRSAQGIGRDVALMWQWPRSAGGVEWISETRQRMYDRAVLTQS